jgi:tRNA pseudouridine55 synthase
MGINGILNVNKPHGCTSFDVISRLRKLTGIKRIGHAGTLDPLATGVLPVCFGQATRIIEYIMGGMKEYICGIELGTVTDTFDAEGRVLGYGDYTHITLPDIEKGLAKFTGDIRQAPPAFSALKLNGKPYYELARSGQVCQPEPRPVHIEGLEIISVKLPYLQLRVTCGRGTYIRSLANDLGCELGCGAYVKDLTRSAYGPFKLADSVELAIIESAGADSLSEFLYLPDYPLLDWAAIQLSAVQERDVICGHDISVTNVAGDYNTYCRAYHTSGRFLAVLKYIPHTGMWHPQKVLA